MRARAQLAVSAGSPPRIDRMVHAAPVGWRVTPDAVYMVATSASPVGDDEISIDVDVGPGARLAVRSSAAGIAWAGAGTVTRVEAGVGPGALLDWQPHALVATARCDHLQVSTVTLAAGARLLWREVLVLGRHGEEPGSLRSELHVTVDGVALLHHSLSVGEGAAGWGGPAVLGAARAVGLVLAVEPGGASVPAAALTGPGWAVMPLAGPGALTVAVAPDALGVERALHRAGHAPG